MAEYARQEINDIGGYYAYGREMINGGSVYDFDVTKLAVYTRDIGLAGIEVYDLLRDEYDIQIELGDIANILAYISIGDRMQDIERLVGALGGYQASLLQRSGEDVKCRVHQSDGSGIAAGRVLFGEKIIFRSGNRPERSAENLLCVIRRGSRSSRRER